jgi:hypothetical protein
MVDMVNVRSRLVTLTIADVKLLATTVCDAQVALQDME